MTYTHVCSITETVKGDTQYKIGGNCNDTS
nr:MAG TPA: hypothetical protein [Bacteriophage sp.]